MLCFYHECYLYNMLTMRCCKSLSLDANVGLEESQHPLGYLGRRSLQTHSHIQRTPFHTLHHSPLESHFRNQKRVARFLAYPRKEGDEKQEKQAVFVTVTTVLVFNPLSLSLSCTLSLSASSN